MRIKITAGEGDTPHVYITLSEEEVIGLLRGEEGFRMEGGKWPMNITVNCETVNRPPIS